jgi:hypothetical protein
VEGGVAGTAAKAALLSKLGGCWGDVALQAAGSFFLEKAYAWAVSGCWASFAGHGSVSA